MYSIILYVSCDRVHIVGGGFKFILRERYIGRSHLVVPRALFLCQA